MAKKKNYVNNAEFYEVMKQYKHEVREAEKDGKEPPKIPDYIGKCLYEIANRLSYKPNFINYSFREDMIADGLENAVMAINNFDPDKSKNPFSYFTKIIWFAYIRRIQKEKKQLYIKHKVTEQTLVHDTTGENIPEPTDYMNDFVENYEAAQDRKKEKAKEK